MKREPTALQRAAYEAVVRLGSQSAASKELGRHQGTVRGAVLAYCQITGDPLPEGVSAGGRKKTAAAVMHETPERLDRIEGLLADQILAGEAMRMQIADLTAAIEGFMARQPLILEVRPRHERQADGGRGGREELRSTGRALRKAVAS